MKNYNAWLAYIALGLAICSFIIILCVGYDNFISSKEKPCVDTADLIEAHSLPFSCHPNADLELLTGGSVPRESVLCVCRCKKVQNEKTK